MRLIAVDWSGARTGATRKIWLAEADASGLLRLECGRSREALTDHLIALAATDGEMVIGFDFAFSLPAWFLSQEGFGTAPEMWAAAASRGEEWLRTNPPFWGGVYGRRLSYPEIQDPFRASDLSIQIGAIRPKSVFQVGGGGSVGTGSVRGWPTLHRLYGAGFAVWPFTPAARPLVIEIYPRVLTAAVNKSSAMARKEYLDRRYPEVDEPMRALAASNDDAFDAAVSALVMAAHASDFFHLPEARDRGTLLEGIIWHPGMQFEGAGT